MNQITVVIPATLVAEFARWAREHDLHLRVRHCDQNVIPFPRRKRQHIDCPLPEPPEAA